MLFNLCLRHGKGIMPALEMIVAEDRTSYDWKIRIGAKEIMWEQLYKIKQLDKCISLDLHRSMLTVKYDTMFIVVNIWRVLEAPWTVIDGNRDDPVVLPCRMIDSSCIAFIFRTKQTFWIAAGFYQLGSCDSLWVFFRLGQVDRDIDLAIFAVYCPFLIFFYAITSDIVTVLTQLIKIICGFFRIFFISIPEFSLHLGRTRHQTVHQFCIKEISVHNTVLDDAPLYSLIKKFVQSLLKIDFSILCLRFCIFAFPKGIQKKIGCINSFAFWSNTTLHPILYQFFNTFT